MKHAIFFFFERITQCHSKPQNILLTEPQRHRPSELASMNQIRSVAEHLHIRNFSHRTTIFFFNQTSLVFLAFFTESLVSSITDSLNIIYIIRNNLTSFLTNLLNIRQSTLDILYKTPSSPGIYVVKFAPPPHPNR